MLLNTNFVKRPDSLVGLSVAFLWGCAAVFAMASLWFYTQSIDHREELLSLNERRGELKERYDSFQAAAVDTPSPDRVQALGQMVEVLNGLASFEGLSVSAILARMEERLPDQAYLVRFSYKPAHGEAHLVVEARDVAPLTEFLGALEREEAFQDVLLSRQLHLQRQSIEYTQYEIRLRSTL